MPTATILIHVEHEGPGRLALALAARGFQLDARELHRGALVPSALPRGDLLVVMGGPMGVADCGSALYPFLAAEVDLLKRCLADGTPVLGICLGAQLLAHAAGAAVMPNTRPGVDGLPSAAREVGWAPVSLYHPRPELVGLHGWEWMLHWHGDTFALPAGAVLLASTPVCRHQAFRLPRAIGLQFHPEVEGDTIDLWCELDAEYARSAGGDDAPQRIRADTRRLATIARPAGDRLISNCLDALLA
jgi:GMP synthase (glutamine-hydrolysing)